MTRVTRQLLRSACTRFASAIACAVAGISGPASLSTPAVAVSPYTLLSQPAFNRDFRLGTASRPLGWSTAVADFNRDGTPDFAIADRVGHSASGYLFRLEFSVSGLQTQTVALDSAQEALTLRASDLDNDDDLDVVVTATLSHAVVGVWLNDGHGSFGKSDVVAVPLSIAATSEVTGDRLPAAVPTNGIAADRFVGLTASRARAPAVHDASAAACHDACPARITDFSSSESRAPPEDPLPSIA